MQTRPDSLPRAVWIISPVSLGLHLLPRPGYEFHRDELLYRHAARAWATHFTPHALQLAAAHGAQTVDLSTRPAREAAIRLHQRVGFARRETTLYRYQPGRDDQGG